MEKTVKLVKMYDCMVIAPEQVMLSDIVKKILQFFSGSEVSFSNYNNNSITITFGEDYNEIDIVNGKVDYVEINSDTDELLELEQYLNLLNYAKTDVINDKY